MKAATGKQKSNPTSKIPTPGSQRTISLPILVGSVVGLLILLPGLYFWRLRQVDRGAHVYLERAESLAKEEQWGQSADYLYLYLRLRPDDAAARVQLAETVDRAAVQRPQILRATELYYQALATASSEEQPRLRARLADLLIQSEQFDPAIDEASKLLERDTNDPEARRLLALALYGAAVSGGLDETRYTRPQVGEQLEKACESKPNDVALVTTLADVLRKHPDLQSASTRALSQEEREAIIRRCFDRLVASAPREASAYLARYQDRQRRAEAADSPEADADIRTALELAPENAVILVAAASHERRTMNRPEASSETRAEALRRSGEYYGRAMRVAPAFDRAYVGLGEVQKLSGEAELAVRTWQQGIEKCGADSVILHALLADESITLGKYGLAQDHIDRIEALAESLRRRGVPESRLTFARSSQLLLARLKLAQKDVEAGRAILRTLAKGAKGDSDQGMVTYQALMLLAASYAAQDREMAEATYQEAANTRPNASEPQLALASLYLAIGEPDRAVSAIKKAIELDDRAENRVLLVGAILQSQLKLAPASRNWEALEAALASARAAVAKPEARSQLWRLGVLEAQYQAQRAGGAIDTRAAQSVLLATEKAMAPGPEGLVGLAAAYAQFGLPQDEQRVLDLLRTKYAQSPAAVLATARALAARGDFEAARSTVTKALENVNTNQRRLLQLALVSLLAEEGRSDEAWAALEALHRERPQDRDILQQLMDFALSARRLAEAEKLEGAFAKLPSVNNAEVDYYRGRRLLATPDSSNEHMQQIGQLVATIKEQAPESPAGYVLEAELLERKGLIEKAAQSYQRALQLGDRQSSTVERLIVLLNQLGRFSEAAEYLSALQNVASDRGVLPTLEIVTALGSGQNDAALRLAQQRVAKQPNDAMAHVWLGQVFLANKDFAAAEQAITRALELAPQDPRTQGAMMSVLVRSGQTERARTKLEEFAGELKVTPVQKALILAAGYESIGAQEDALAQLRQAEKLEPANANIQEQIGLTLLGQDPVEAEKYLQGALKLEPNLERSRRALARLLASRGGTKNLHAAIDLLAGSHAGDANLTQNQLLQATMLAQRGDKESRIEARKILEPMAREGEQAAQFLLAQIAELDGDAELAGQQYLELASRPNPQPAHLAAYIDWLLRRDSPSEVSPWMAKLEEVDPDGIETAGLRVRWLIATDRQAEIENTIEDFARRWLQPKVAGQTPDRAQKLGVSRIAGDLYLSAGEPAAAERWHRRTVALEPKEYGRLANVIARQGRIDEAIEICRRAAESDASARPAQTLAEVLVGNHLGEGIDLAAAEALFAEALARHPDQAGLLTAVANLRIVQSRSEDAVKLYRQVVDLQPNNVDALNNLAALLADRPDGQEEALALLDKAIEIAGPQPNLVDTKGTILLTQNRLAEALPLLKVAAASPNPDPRYLFHWAVGQFRSGEIGGARKAFEDAQRRKLKEAVLTQEDSEMLAELSERLR